MTTNDAYDDFAKSLAEALPRRESLRRLGAVLAGGVLGSLGMENVWAARSRRVVDPCKAFCNCRKAKDKNQCLAACKACNKDTTRLCGGCGAYVCCAPGKKCCSGACTDVSMDFNNCGACGNRCAEPGPYEYGACISGKCSYICDDGASLCDGTCTYLSWDPDNCGACGNVCGGATPYCNDGVCSECYPGYSSCDDACVDLEFDRDNCGACGHRCGGATPFCSYGVCTDCAWPSAICNGVCTDLMWDHFNCGACGNQCPPGSGCAFGICGTPCPDCSF